MSLVLHKSQETRNPYLPSSWAGPGSVAAWTTLWWLSMEGKEFTPVDMESLGKIWGRGDVMRVLI